MDIMNYWLWKTDREKNCRKINKIDFTVWNGAHRFTFVAILRAIDDKCVEKLNEKQNQSFSKMVKNEQSVQRSEKEKFHWEENCMWRKVNRRRDVERAASRRRTETTTKNKKTTTTAAAAATNRAKWTFYTYIFLCSSLSLASAPLCEWVCASFLRLHDFGVTDGRVAYNI